MEVETKNISVVEEFMKGAKKGWYIGVELIGPAMIMAYALIEFIKISGLLTKKQQKLSEEYSI